MATADWDFLNTRNEIIQDAFMNIGELAPGEVMTGEQLALGKRKLGTIVKSWSGKHYPVWNHTSISQTLTPSTASYTLSADPKIFFVEDAAILNGTSNDPVEVISYDEYLSIPEKTKTGQPYQVAFKRSQTPTIYVYPTPEIGHTLYLYVNTYTKDFDTASGSGDVPSEWQEALIWELSHSLAFGSGIRLGEQEYLKGKAREALIEAKAQNYEHENCSFVRGAFRNG